MVYHPPRQAVANPKVLEYLRRDCCNKAEAYRIFIEVFNRDTKWSRLHEYLTKTCGYSWPLSYDRFTVWMNALLTSVVEIEDAIRQAESGLPPIRK